MRGHPQDESLESLVLEFFHLLDIVETNDEGRTFRPTTISTCRAMDGERIGELLLTLREKVGLPRLHKR